jgi:hypothetical protein
VDVNKHQNLHVLPPKRAPLVPKPATGSVSGTRIRSTTQSSPLDVLHPDHTSQYPQLPTSHTPLPVSHLKPSCHSTQPPLKPLLSAGRPKAARHRPPSPISPTTTIALGTGGSQGIGLESGSVLSDRDGYRVVLGSRSPENGAAGVEGENGVYSAKEGVVPW